MALSACGAPAATEAPAPPPAATEAPAPTAAPVATEAPAATAAPAAAACPTGYDFGPVTGGPAGGFLEQAVAGEFKGTTVTVDGTQTDPDDQKMKCGWQAFEDATGITVNYIGNKEFEARISIAVDAGQAPDIADFPQPGLLRRFVDAGQDRRRQQLHAEGLPDQDLQSELAGHGDDEGAERTDLGRRLEPLLCQEPRVVSEGRL